MLTKVLVIVAISVGSVVALFAMGKFLNRDSDEVDRSQKKD